ncbi:MAG: molybdate ABC transporter substrate-binding protein [Planctomycetes bacterium]|nr:molybdate ABC transporter substrate-binding protein [Planctomycetota bacterium]
MGSATKPAMEEIAKLFEKQFNVRMELHFGSSGAMLSQMQIARRGDIYFPGSTDFMEKARKLALIVPETEKTLLYLLPAINVQRGNPKGIKSLADLAKPGMRVAVANPRSVCVGLYAVEILEGASLGEKVRANIVTYPESCAATCRTVALKQVDAVLGWRVFQHWSPRNVESLLIDPKFVPRVCSVPIAVSRFSRNRDLAEKFVSFAASERGKAVFRKWHYLCDEGPIRKFAPQARIGGKWELPEQWR